MENFLHADGDAPVGNGVQIGARVHERVDGLGLPCQLQHTGGALEEFLVRAHLTGFRRLIEGDMSRDADAAPAHIQLAQLLDGLPDAAFVARLGENSLLLRHEQLGVYQTVEDPVHAAAERQRVGLGQILLVLIQIFVHVDEPAVLQADPVLVDKLHQPGVGAKRAIGNDHNGLFALGVVFLNQLQNLDRHLPIKIHLCLAQLNFDVAALAQLGGGNRAVVCHIVTSQNLFLSILPICCFYCSCVFAVLQYMQSTLSFIECTNHREIQRS